MIWRVVPQPSEWENIGNRIDATMIFARFLELESAIRLILRDLLDKTLSSLKISVHQNRAGLANGQFLSARLMAFSELQSQS